MSHHKQMHFFAHVDSEHHKLSHSSLRTIDRLSRFYKILFHCRISHQLLFLI